MSFREDVETKGIWPPVQGQQMSDTMFDLCSAFIDWADKPASGSASGELFLAWVDHGYDGLKPIGVFSSEDKAWAGVGRDTQSLGVPHVKRITLDDLLGDL